MGERRDPTHVQSPPARNALDRFIRRFNYTAYVVAILFLYVVASTAVGVALAPALFLFELLRGVGMEWAGPARLIWLGTSLGLSFFTFGFALMLVVPLYNFLLPTRVHPFKGGYFTVAAVPFYLHNGLFYLVRYTVLPFFTLTPFGLLFLKAMGMKIGHRVFVNTELISDPRLITLEDHAVLGGSVRVFAHWGGGGHLCIAPVRIRRAATIGLCATIMGDVEVGAGAVVLPHSVVLPGSRVGAGETWGGVPARPIGAEERERFRRLVQGLDEGEEP
jgi:acetyltransferase-like isoleucine patch superfamily enzyme